MLAILSSHENKRWVRGLVVLHIAALRVLAAAMGGLDRGRRVRENVIVGLFGERKVGWKWRMDGLDARSA